MKTNVSLNPCCNGIPSDVLKNVNPTGLKKVLIPVVMEYPLTLATSQSTLYRVCLNPCCNGIPSDPTWQRTLIGAKSLNPCCNGIPSD